MRVYEAILRTVAGGVFAPDILVRARVFLECLDEATLLSELPEDVGLELEDLEGYLGGLIGECVAPEFEIKNYDVTIAIAMAGDLEMARLVASILISTGIHRHELEVSAMHKVEDLIESIDRIADGITRILRERIRKALMDSMRKYFETMRWQA